MSNSTKDLTRKERMRAYWNREIGHWAKTSYEGSGIKNLVDKFMSNLRRSVKARAEIAHGILAERIKGKTLLDLGCGHGGFALGLIDAGAVRVEGWDISEEAVRLANEAAKAKGVSDRAVFKVALVEDGNFPEADFTTGLGLLDWMPEHEIEKMLGLLKGRKVMFSFSELDWTFDEIVHRIWLCKRLEYFGGGVRAYHHTRKQIHDWFDNAGLGPVEIIARKEARFGRLVHNLNNR